MFESNLYFFHGKVGVDRRESLTMHSYCAEIKINFELRAGEMLGEIEMARGNSLLAEGEGFEPPDLSVNGFQDRRLKPLGHPSTNESSLASQALSRSSCTFSFALSVSTKTGAPCGSVRLGRT